MKVKPSASNSTMVDSSMDEDGPGKKMQLKKPLEIYIYLYDIKFATF